MSNYYNTFSTPIRHRYELLFEFINRITGTGRFLDIGSGMGFSLEVAKSFGWTSKGIEPNGYLARNAQLRGLDVDNVYFDEQFSGQFDLILIDNVLEHVPDPLKFLQQARRLISPTGLIVIAVPPVDWLRRALATSGVVRNYVKAPQANIFCEVDEHLSMFGRSAMHKLTTLASLRSLNIRFHHHSIYDNKLARMFGIDDGYYFVVTSDTTRSAQ